MLVSGVLLFDLDTGFLRYQKKFAPRFGLATSSSLDPVRVCLQLLVFQQFADFHLRSFGNVTMKRINGQTTACVVIGPVAEVREQVAEKLKLALGEDDLHIGSCASTNCSTTPTPTATGTSKISKKVLGEKVKTAVVDVHLEQIFREELTKNPILRYMAFCFKTPTSAALASRSTTDTATATTAGASATARSGSTATEQTPNWASDARRRERAASAARNTNPAFNIGQGIVPDDGGGGASGAVQTPQSNSNTTRRRLWRWVPCFPSRPRSRSGVLGGASATPTPTATPATATAARARANTAGTLWNSASRGEQLLNQCSGSGAEGGLVVFLLSRGTSGDGNGKQGNAPGAAEEEVDVDEITLDVIRKKVLDVRNAQKQDQEAGESDEITRKMKVTRSCTSCVGAGAEDVVILSSHDPDLSDEDWTTLKTCTQYLTEKVGRLYPHYVYDEDEPSGALRGARRASSVCSALKREVLPLSRFLPAASAFLFALALFFLYFVSLDVNTFRFQGRLRRSGLCYTLFLPLPPRTRMCGGPLRSELAAAFAMDSLFRLRSFCLGKEAGSWDGHQLSAMQTRVTYISISRSSSSFISKYFT